MSGLPLTEESGALIASYRRCAQIPDSDRRAVIYKG